MNNQGSPQQATDMAPEVIAASGDDAYRTLAHALTQDANADRLLHRKYFSSLRFGGQFWL